MSTTPQGSTLQERLRDTAEYLSDVDLVAQSDTAIAAAAHIDALEARERELVGRLSSQSVALEAIAGMTIDDRTEHAQLSALMKAIAKKSIEGAI